MRFSCTSVALLAVIAIPVAHAETLLFTITEGTSVLTFTLPSNPTPSLFTPDSIFYVNNVSAVLNGSATTDNVGFYTTDGLGGFTDNYFGDPFGAQFFSGDVSSPTFAPGVYDFSAAPDGPTEGTLAIVAAAPEPSALVLFGTGALGVAGMARRRFRRA